MFGKLRVWDTEHNNGVLIYLLLAEHAIEIVADRGLNRHVPPEEWQPPERTACRRPSGPGASRTAWAQAIDAVDGLLGRHFPLAEGTANPNELPDRAASLRARRYTLSIGFSGPLKRSRFSGVGSSGKSICGSGSAMSGTWSSRWRISVSRPRRWSLKSTSVHGAWRVCVAFSMRSRAVP